MSEAEKKGIGKTKVALGVSVVLLIFSLIANAWLYAQTTSLESNYETLDLNYNDYKLRHSHTDSEYNSLQSEYDDYKSTHHYTDTQYSNLETEIDSLKAPILRGIDVMASDINPWIGTPYLHIYGYFCNVGTDTTHNAKLYVEAFQGNVLTFNKSIDLGTIEGEDFVYIDEKLYYEGESLTKWHVWTVPSGYDYTS